MGIRAKSSNTGISVKKLKPIVNLVRGMKVEEALTTLRFMPSPAAARVAKTVKSAASNAENELMARIEDLKISEIFAKSSFFQQECDIISYSIIMRKESF